MFKRPKGTADILPGVSGNWQFVEETAKNVFENYQFHEIRTPLFEHYEVLARTVGDTTDIVNKEMYDFYDKGDRHIALRPEGTAPVVRAYIENKLYGPEFQKPYKTYYVQPMFRYERPQAGRMRQFHQIGVEVFGSENPATDVEAMAMVMHYFQALGVKHLKLVINSLGNRESREKYRQALIDYLLPYEGELSEDSRRRIQENPLRVLDSKDKRDQKIISGAPSILEFLNESSAKYFAKVQEMLNTLSIPFVVDATMVRGLDYYNETIFEVMSDAPGFGGAITTICGGGRYDGLVATLDGPETAGFGFAMGIERILITLEAEGITVPTQPPLDVYVVGLGEVTNTEVLKLVQAVRLNGLSAERDFLNRKAKAQFKTANKLQAKVVLTLGETELTEGKVNLKIMATGQEKNVYLAEIYENFKTVWQEVIEITKET